MEENVNNEEKVEQGEQKKVNLKKKALWTIVFILIAVLSVIAVVSQTKDFSFKEFANFVKTSNKLYLILAVLSMLCFITFEGVALQIICRYFGNKTKFKDGFVYSSADIYFSAITPSATGGQPASAFFMVRDGLSGSFVAFALFINLLMYTISTITLGLLALIFGHAMFLHFTTFSKIIFILGFFVLSMLIVLIVLLLFKKGFLDKICSGFVKFLAKLHILKKPENTLAKLEKKMDDYKEHTSMLKGKGLLLLFVFLFNFLQRVAQVVVTPLTFLASGGDPKEAFNIFWTQTYVMVGANCVPIPGAMGVTDYIMIDGFEDLPAVESPAFLELLSRSLSFYLCIFVAGLTILLSSILHNKFKKKGDKK